MAQGSAIYAERVTSSLLTGCTFRNHDNSASVILAGAPLNWNCPLGTWAPVTGAIPRPGYSPDFTGCPYGCPQGTIGHRHNITDSADCQSCLKGHYCNETGLTLPYACPVGTRMPSFGARSVDDCLPCGSGQQRDRAGAVHAMSGGVFRGG
jgi:hypothetical protein